MIALRADHVRWLAFLAAIVLLLFGAQAVLGEEKRVAGTKHDVAPVDTSPCIYCHIPGDGESQLLRRASDDPELSFSGLRPLCFSCHDGTVTDRGAYLFAPDRPLHPATPGVRGQDCDRCHNPHEEGPGKFLKVTGDANFCINCHLISGIGHPVDVRPEDKGITPLDTHWDPLTGDFSGARLWNPEGTGPGDLIKCLTCHSPHGGQPGTEMNTMPITALDESAPLCMNCHRLRGGG
jgi:predicted CXXCH cytochrome family protein